MSSFAAATALCPPPPPAPSACRASGPPRRPPPPPRRPTAAASAPGPPPGVRCPRSPAAAMGAAAAMASWTTRRCSGRRSWSGWPAAMRTRPAGEEAAGVGMGRGRVAEEAGRAPRSASPAVPGGKGLFPGVCLMSEGISGLCVRRQPRPLGWVKGLMSSTRRTEACRGRVFRFLRTALELPGGPGLCAAARPRWERYIGALGHREGSGAAAKSAVSVFASAGDGEALRNLWEISRVVQNLAHRYC